MVSKIAISAGHSNRLVLKGRINALGRAAFMYQDIV